MEEEIIQLIQNTKVENIECWCQIKICEVRIIMVIYDLLQISLERLKLYNYQLYYTESLEIQSLCRFVYV